MICRAVFTTLIPVLMWGSTILDEKPTDKPFGEWRVRTIRGWDRLLTWSLKPDNTPYILMEPPEIENFEVENAAVFAFDQNYGFFSTSRPIVGMVTREKRDFDVASALLQVLPESAHSAEQLHFSTDEVLAKVVAYRDLKKGMTLKLSVDGNAVVYTVDTRIDLWRGMPAFGLLPTGNSQATPILLFRGTDFTLTTEKGWASILSDLDLSGPGHSTFLRAQKEIHKWLSKRVKEGRPARAVGFSLGGGFVLYTMIYEHELLSTTAPSRAFNPPGVPDKLLAKWKKIPEESRPPHMIYVNQGDVVSKVGFFPSDVWEVNLDHPMEVIESHVTLISAQPKFHIRKVDVDAENRSRQ